MVRAPVVPVVAIALVAGLTLGACRQPRGEIVLQVDTDLPECAVRELTLGCAYDWDGVTERDRNACDRDLPRGMSTAQYRLPTNFIIWERKPERLGDPVTIAVSGRDTPGLRRVARVNYVPGESLVLRIDLRAACLVQKPVAADHPCPSGRASCAVGESCEIQGLTCGNEGTCRAIDIDPAELVPLEDAGAILDVSARDGATDPASCRDAGTDTANDAGTDAGTDAAVRD